MRPLADKTLIILIYSQAMHEANALTKRIVKYVSVVTFLSLVFTITRFFEAKIEYGPDDYNVTRPYIAPTSMRTAPIYTTYSNWSRLIVLGIIPFVALVYLNTKIYQVHFTYLHTFTYRCKISIKKQQYTQYVL